jgi:hypothetical protein
MHGEGRIAMKLHPLALPALAAVALFALSLVPPAGATPPPAPLCLAVEIHEINVVEVGNPPCSNELDLPPSCLITAPPLPRVVVCLDAGIEYL